MLIDDAIARIRHSVAIMAQFLLLKDEAYTHLKTHWCDLDQATQESMVGVLRAQLRNEIFFNAFMQI